MDSHSKVGCYARKCGQMFTESNLGLSLHTNISKLKGYTQSITMHRR